MRTFNTSAIEPIPAIEPPPQVAKIWRSQKNLTRIPNLEQICFGTSTLSSVQTVFDQYKLFRGTITVPHPGIGGFDTPRSKETGIRKQPRNGLLQA